MSESLFTSQIPTNLTANDSRLITLGTVIRCGVAGSITAGRWYFPSPIPFGTTNFVLYDLLTQVQLSRVGFVAPVPGGWNTVTLATPVVVIANQVVVASVVTNDRYVASSGVFASSGITNGNLTAPPTTEITNGRFKDGFDGFPADTFGGGCYFADIVFDATPVVEVPPDVTPPVATPTPSAAGWYGLLATQQLAQQFHEEDAAEPPAACPNDGEPLVVNEYGERRCPFDGWQWRG